MKKSLILAGMLSIGYAYAQEYDGKVGINTTEPKATLDIVAKNTDGSTKEGLLIPRLSKANIAKITNPETSTLAYINATGYTTGTDTAADNRVALVDATGYYYYNGTQWKKLRTDELFYQTETTKDASGKTQNIYRLGKMGIGVSTPIASIHASGHIAGRAHFYWDINVNPDTGNDSTTDEVFATLDEAVAYANSIVNNQLIRIRLSAGKEYTLSSYINRNIVFYGNATINIPKTIDLASNTSILFEGPTINQNATNAFRTFGNSKISIGGHARTIWNFTANDQSIVYNYYADWGNGGEVHLSLDRATLNTNSFTGIKYMNGDSVTSTGRMVLSYWDTTLPTDISYAGVSRILPSYNATTNLINHQVGSPFIFSGLESNGTLVERMRVHTNGNVGIGTTSPTNALHIKADADPLKLEGLQEGTGSTLVVDANGVVKKGSAASTSTTATNGVQTDTTMVCNDTNLGKINFGNVTINEKNTQAFGFCMKNSDGQAKWYYIYGGAATTSGAVNGTFGS